MATTTKKAPTSVAEPCDIMLDLETCGTAPGCVVLSIGAVIFSAKGLHDEFHQIIQLDSSLNAGLSQSADTMAWLERQSKEAQETLRVAKLKRHKDSKPVDKAIQSFNDWVVAHCGSNAAIWGNGANFDQPILRAVYDAVGEFPVWSPFKERCYRTLKGLVIGGPKLSRQGTYHNALDDAKSQAAHAVELLKILAKLQKA